MVQTRNVAQVIPYFHKLSVIENNCSSTICLSGFLCFLQYPLSKLPRIKVIFSKLYLKTIQKIDLSNVMNKEQIFFFPGTNSTSALLQQQQRQQQQLLQHQDRQLGVMSDSVGNLRNVSSAIGRELDEQAVSWIVLLFFQKVSS